MYHLRKTAIAALSALLLFLPCFSSLASEPADTVLQSPSAYTAKVVRVGISDSSYFSEKQEDGSYAGILTDYLQEISKYAGWNLEYIEGSTDELTQKLAAGEIDLMGGILKNETTLPLYDFAEYNSGYSYTTINVGKDDDRYIPMDYASLEGMRIGIFSKALGRISALNSFTQANSLNLVPVYFDDFNLCAQALQEGEIDGFLTNDTSLVNNTRIVARFDAIPYYFAVTKGKTALLTELNLALSTILEVNPKFDNIVYEKYFNTTGGNLAFNKNEKAFIRDSPVLKSAVISSLAPIEYFADDDSSIKGIAPDVLKLISSRTGLQFEFVRVDTLAEAKQMLLAGKVDLITSIGGNDPNAEPGTVFTKIFLDTQRILIKNATQKDPAQRIFAAIDGYSYAYAMDGYETVSFPTIQDCIQAVVSGNAAYTTCNNLLIDHYSYFYNNSNISFTPVANASEGLSFALSQQADPVLLSILDKTIYSLPHDDIQAIVYENTTSDNADLSLMQLLYSNPMTMAAAAAAICTILAIVIVLLSLFIRTRLKLTQQVALQGDAYRIISELTNEYIFTFDFHSQCLLLPAKFASLTGRRIKHSLTTILDGNDEVLKTLYSTFSKQEGIDRISLEFHCPLKNSRDAWFKAVGTILFDTNKKPLRGIGRITSIQTEWQEKQILEAKANTDSLTLLYNRQYSEQKIMEFFQQNQDSVNGVLMVMDLDYFKKINDTLGHLAGDQVLKEFAGILKSEFRSGDIIGRWGGDEFIAFLCGTQEEIEISDRAQHLCDIMNRDFHYEEKSHHLSISVGIATTKKASSYPELFKHADMALYAVKNQHRGGFKIF